MQVGDRCLFYHSNCKVPGVAGVVRVVKQAYADPTAFQPDHPYYDAKSSIDKPRWFTVDVQLEQKFPRLISLAELKSKSELDNMNLFKQKRLSVSSVRESEFEFIVSMASQEVESN
eukprot:TRINITY_DN7396_c0_g1_i3.p1 TRINITY_DN7396_c0_g1~~TRINITY_DN7396_c0_g1_i3.p1  ORF type:complete len:116 (+),score=7.87 TRINITY_DN7396_c0_g1_i3:36-383(+)